ncbi:hypothetical protein [Ferrimonas senticii]|uniref:hypothetical protein n=1 Tax=Ferrimonas senticii TaxID=394566 RepID=UPI0003F7A93E|nr:hypothetical protein [Ferrimonas senticii]
MNLATGQKDESGDRIWGIALIVVGALSLLFTESSAWLLERLFALVILVVGAFFMFTSKKPLGIIGGILALLMGGNLLVKPGDGILLLALAVGLYFVFSGYQAYQAVVQTGWSKLNGVVTILLGLLTLWQWGDATATIIAVAVGLKLMLIGLYFNAKATEQAKHNASVAQP